MNSVVIVGASGFLGGALLESFRRRGWNVLGVGRIVNNSRDYLRIENWDVDSLGATMRSVHPDLVVYVAGPADVAGSFDDPELDMREQLLPLVAVLGGVRKQQAKCRVLLISSAAVYGEPHRLPVAEGHPIAPLSPYGYHKALQEAILREYAALYGIRTCVARLFSVFGPRQRRLAIYEMTRRALNGEYLVRGTGAETRDYLFVDDAANAVVSVAERAAFCGDVLNVASGCGIDMRSVASAIYATLGISSAPRFDGNAPVGGPICWVADVSRLSRLEFTRQVSFEDGMARTVDWIRNDENRSGRPGYGCKVDRG